MIYGQILNLYYNKMKINVNNNLPLILISKDIKTLKIQVE